MCKISRTFIPDKHTAWWNMHRNSIMWNSGHDESVWDLLMSINYTK